MTTVNKHAYIFNIIQRNWQLLTSYGVGDNRMSMKHW